METLPAETCHKAWRNWSRYHQKCGTTHTHRFHVYEQIRGPVDGWGCATQLVRAQYPERIRNMTGPYANVFIRHYINTLLGK